jgi:hypothetical protein
MAFSKPSNVTNALGAYKYKGAMPSSAQNYIDNNFPNLANINGANIWSGSIEITGTGSILFDSGSNLDGYGANVHWGAGTAITVDSSTETLTYSTLNLNSYSNLRSDSTSSVIFNGNTTLNGNNYLNGNTAAGNVTVGGTLGVTGSTTISSSLSVGSTFAVTGSSTLSTLSVTGATNLNTLGGDTSIGGTLTVGTNFIVDGLSTFENYIYVLSGGASIVGDSTFTGNLYITGSSNSISCDGNISCGAVGSGSFAFGSSGPDMGAHNGVPIGTPANGSFSLRTDISDRNNQIWQYNSTAGWYNPNAYDIRTYTEVTGNYTLLLTDNTIGMNQTGSTTITFPASGMEIGRTYTIAVRSSSASIGYNGNGNSINPSPSSAQTGGSRSYLWTGSVWLQV